MRKAIYIFVHRHICIYVCDNNNKIKGDYQLERGHGKFGERVTARNWREEREGEVIEFYSTENIFQKKKNGGMNLWADKLLVETTWILKPGEPALQEQGDRGTHAFSGLWLDTTQKHEPWFREKEKRKKPITIDWTPPPALLSSTWEGEARRLGVGNKLN